MSNFTASANSNDGAVIDQLLDALSAGDIEAVRACCTEDVVFWHCFDQIAQDFNEAARGFEQFFAGFPERRFVDARREPISGGFMLQHVMVGTTASGKRLGWPICVVVRLRDGLVSRYEEYIDRAGSYAVTEGDFATRGL